MKRIDASGRDIAGLYGLHGPTDTVTLTGDKWDSLDAVPASASGEPKPDHRVKSQWLRGFDAAFSMTLPTRAFRVQQEP